MDRTKHDPPFESGSQSVPERAPEVPGPGRSALQTIFIIGAALVLVAGILWLLVPILSSR